MRIEEIKIRNFRGLVREDVAFDPHLTVVSGANGGGKSTLLDAVGIMLSWLPAKISNISKSGRRITESDITTTADFSRLEMTLRASGGNAKPMTLTLFKCRAGKDGTAECVSGASDMAGAAKYGEDMRVLLDSPEGQRAEIPVLAYYGADRNEVGYCTPFPDASRDRLDIYRNAFAAGADFEKLSAWLVSVLERRDALYAAGRALPAKLWRARKAEIDADFAVLKTISRAISGFLPRLEKVVAQNGKLFVGESRVPAQYLSAGEKAAVSLITDLAIRMTVANPLKKNPLRTSAVILIDEIDLHLHPQWQSRIASALPRIFPKAQFIISSHSPSVISVARRVYRINSAERESRIESLPNQFGRAPSDILRSILNSRREAATAEKIRQMYEALDRRDVRTASRIIEALTEIIPDDPEVLRGEYLLRAII